MPRSDATQAPKDLGFARVCGECHGTGRISQDRRPPTGGGYWLRDRECLRCKGTGEAKRKEPADG